MTKRVKFTITINPTILKTIRRKAVDLDVSHGVLVEFALKEYVQNLQFKDNGKRLKAYNETIKKQRSDERKLR